MIVGYARTSTVEQIAGFEAQIEELKEAGCEKLFQEQVSSVGKRAQLTAALEFVREDDVLVVTKLDRLARSVRDLMNTIAHLDRKKVGLNTQIFAEVKLNAHGRSNFTQFTDAIRGFPQVLECYVLMGSVDFLLRIVTPDIEAYERFFFEQLSMVPGIQEVNSIVALSEIKSTTCLPV